MQMMLFSFSIIRPIKQILEKKTEGAKDFDDLSNNSSFLQFLPHLSPIIPMSDL